MPRKKSPRSSAENTIRYVRRNSRRTFSGEEKIRIGLEGLCGEENEQLKQLVAELVLEIEGRWPINLKSQRPKLT
jgi:hypothetical protein